tara:strand:- start:3289 stop:6303 length:3015 start_codon:yes stop_codon:yes gene_type:complete
MRLKSLITLFVSVLVLNSWAQNTIPLNGVNTPIHSVYALTNAHIVISSTAEIESGTLLLKDDRIIGVGSQITIPPNAIILDLHGKYIYPSFIELVSNYGLPEVPKRKKMMRPEYVAKNNGTTYWNDAIHPQTVAATQFEYDKKTAETLRNMGFGVTLSHPFNGIMRGTGVLVSLGENTQGSAILREKGAAFYGFGKGNSAQAYPTSLMGSIALFRQARYDAQWYETSNKKPVNYSLQAINENADLPQIFDAKGYQSILRAAKIGQEFETSFIITGGGDEYKRIEAIKNLGASLIIPLDFPKPYDVSDPLDAEYVSLGDMKNWELAPSNPAILSENGVAFALSATANPTEFWDNLRLAIRYGLPQNTALASLTENPAKMLKMTADMGTLESGKLANFFITDEDVFKTKSKVLENWTLGKRNIIENVLTLNPTGNYNMNLGGVLYQMDIIETKKGYAISTTMGGTAEDPQKGAISIENDLLTIKFEKGNHKNPGPLRMVGKVNFKGKIMDGKAQDANGNWADWTAIKQKSISIASYGDSLKVLEQRGKVFYPNMAFGDTVVPNQQNYFIKNVMIWTSDSTGNFKGSVAISNGKIEAVGKRIDNPGYQEIEGQGMHLSPGIIDEHSHIAIKRGVNESGQNNSAEVRIGDVINPDDINMYRQLAGGVTSAQLLHGSANPIGGQAQIIKLRWGLGAEELKLKSNAKSIKFALGENVTQSNGDFRSTTRFPQTRMGVEQLYMDAFTRAKKYEESWSTFTNATKKERKNGANPPRRDLELDALVEILHDERYITCHSYIKSEISMLMNVADSLHFRINTFTHILEGYKVANQLKAHGAYASTFSDWWAYKFEVNDAIPYNAAILTKQGVVTAINSDDAEMGRRLNQEAAKVVKYGGVSEIEAMKMITINPAKMLHIDDKVGSISVGKDADLVLWSGHPLSVYSHPEMVMIDGAIYYSTERNKAMLVLIKAERQRLILAMMNAKNKGAKMQKVKHKTPQAYHCDSFEDEVNF